MTLHYLTSAQPYGRALGARLAFFSIILVTGIVLYLTSFSIPPAQAATAPHSRYFVSTEHSVSGSFLSFYDSHGGIRIFGYPISDSVTENGRPVQYFERQRFEYHSEAAGTANEVQLGRLGAELAPARAMSQSSPAFASTLTRVFVKQTRHSLSDIFLAYWLENGDIRVLGYPITELMNENGRLVQYFERARLEYHPEKASAGYAVELGALGRQFVAAHPDIAARLAASAHATTSNSRGGSAPAQPQQSASLALSGKENELLNRINDARKALGAGVVTLDRKIKSVALARSADMVARDYFSHTSPDGKDFLSMLRAAGLKFKFAGEIITNNNYSEQVTANQAFISFMTSPHHHEILVDPRYSLVGIGEATSANGFHYFTVIFVQM